MDIPSIDMGPALAGNRMMRAQTAQKIAKAAERTGFLIIENHGLPADLLHRAFAECAEFFALPPEDKNLFHPRERGVQRGYHGTETRNLASTLDAAAPPDLRESLFFGPFADHRHHYREIPEAALIYAPNILPDRPAGLAATLRELYARYEETGRAVLRLVALALELEENFFTNKFSRHFNIMGCHHYPLLQQAPRSGQMRAGAHTDFGAVTLLAVNDAPGGLEVKTADDEWTAIHPRPGQLVVNLGDMMARWTNDRWVSTLHRVITPPPAPAMVNPRQSIAYFLHPNYDAEIHCIPSCQAGDRPAKYPAIWAGHHIAQKIAKSHQANAAG